MSPRNFILALFLCCQGALHAWWDEGHKVIAEIAHQNLDPEVQEKADELAASFKEFYPGHATFVDSSTWMDDIKGGIQALHPWHYTNIPHDPEQLLSSEQKAAINAYNQDNDVVWAIEKAVQTLKNPTASTFEKALMLKVLIHCVADIHQPLHCGSHYSHDHPDGDQGGSRFHIQGLPMNNLHALWDNGAGAFDGELQKCAAEITHLFPKEHFVKSISDISGWARETHKLAQKVVYKIKENEAPSPKYLAKVKAVSEEQAALAGYRLAQLLNECLKESPEQDVPQ